jgi:hypothetical protein
MTLLPPEELYHMGRLLHLVEILFTIEITEWFLTRFIRLRTIAWNPLGTLIATGAADRTLRV